MVHQNRDNKCTEQKITGKHKVSFKVVPGENETTTGMALRAVTFTKSTVPTIYFNIDETKGSIDADERRPAA